MYLFLSDCWCFCTSTGWSLQHVTELWSQNNTIKCTSLSIMISVACQHHSDVLTLVCYQQCDWLTSPEQCWKQSISSCYCGNNRDVCTPLGWAVRSMDHCHSDTWAHIYTQTRTKLKQCIHPLIKIQQLWYHPHSKTLKHTVCAASVPLF